MLLDQRRRDVERERGIWPDQVLTDYFDQWVSTRPEAVALIDHSASTGHTRTLTFAELDDQVADITVALTRLGVRRGDVVAYQLPNWWQFPALMLACTRLGAVNSPLMPIYRRRELEFILRHSGARVFIAPEQFRGFGHGALARALQREIDTLKHVLLIDGAGDDAFDRHVSPCGPAQGRATVAKADDITQLLYTSGTTGEPKGVLHSSNTLIGTTLKFAERMQLGDGDIVFMPSPLAHQAGYEYGAMVALLLGIPMVMLDIWNPAIALALIARHRATYTFCSTPFLADLASHPGVEDADLSSFRLFVTSGAPIPPPVVAAAQERLAVTVVSGWGMTECGILTTTELDGRKVLESDGHPLPGSAVRIVDEEGVERQRGQEGTLQCTGAGLFVGYLKRPDIYQPDIYQVDAEGWFDTGDLACMDDDGDIRITGRKKDIIIRGGENIPVVEVENALYRMAGIAAAAVVAMPDARLGERACAFVELRPGARLDFAAITAHLDHEGVAKSYWPERLEIVAELPRTASGKIQKFVLREQARALAPAR